MRNCPAQQHGVKAPLVDKFAYKGRPLHSADAHVYANRFELRLHDRGGENALFVALVGQNGKGQGQAIAVEHAIAVVVGKARLCQQGAGSGTILRHGLEAGVVRPRTGLEGPKGRNPLPQQHAVDNALAVYCHGNGTPHTHIFKKRMLKIETKKNIHIGQIPKLVKPVLPLWARGLPQVLQGRKIHHIQPASARFHKHGGVVGYDSVHHLVNARLARKIGGRCFKHHAAARLPRFEAVRPCSHGFAGKGRGADVLAFKNMLGQDGVHPGRNRPRKKLLVLHLKGVAVDDAQFLDTQKIFGIGAAGGRVCRQLAGKGHVFCGELLPVFPQNALAQGKAHAAAFVLHAPRFCRPGLWLQILVVAQGRNIQKLGHLVRGRVGREVGNEV